MRTRVLTRTYPNGGEWIAAAYQKESVFCEARRSSQSTALETLRTRVQEIVTLQGRAWLDQWKQPGPGVVNCPEGAIKLPIDLWVCKLTKEICPIQAQVFLNERDHFIQGCQAPPERKEQVFGSVASGAYDGFHHVQGRGLCVSCEREGKKPSFQHHYPWELTYLDAYYPFDYERDWWTVRKKRKDKTGGLTLVTTALCAQHCKELAAQLDPGLAAELEVIEFELAR